MIPLLVFTCSACRVRTFHAFSHFSKFIFTFVLFFQHIIYLLFPFPPSLFIHLFIAIFHHTTCTWLSVPCRLEFALQFQGLTFSNAFLKWSHFTHLRKKAYKITIQSEEENTFFSFRFSPQLQHVPALCKRPEGQTESHKLHHKYAFQNQLHATHGAEDAQGGWDECEAKLETKCRWNRGRISTWHASSWPQALHWGWVLNKQG